MYYVGDALKEIKKIKATPDGQLDFSTMPKFAVVKRKRNKKGGVEEVDERDLGAMISMLTVAVQQLEKKFDSLS